MSAVMDDKSKKQNMKIKESSSSESCNNNEEEDDQYDHEKKKKKKNQSIKNDNNKNEMKISKFVAFYKLFQFADWIDIALMGLGTIGAISNGLVIPLSTIIFGELINGFGQNQYNNTDVVQPISKVCLKFVYLAIVASVAAFLEVCCWTVTGERQASKIRHLYLKFMLRQDIAFFDKETNTGEVIKRMSGDTILIQEAMGDKVGKFIQLLATFFGSFAVAFMKGWLLTLILSSSIPLIVGVGGVMIVMLGKISCRGQIASAKAANVVEQTINSIRTVASYTGEKEAVEKYDKWLKDVFKAGVLEGLAAGFGFGIIMFFVFCSYSLAIWYGSRMILYKGYTGGDVINVIMAVLVGSTSMGQASPCLSAFTSGQAAAFKIFETIKRNPLIDAYDPNGRTLDDICGNIELKDVCFSYPTRPNELIFDGFCLNIPNGNTLALVGESGSGKSTVISLIERFYDPQAGEILIDGVNLKEFQLKWIRSKIGLVSQEPVLFTSSIKDNIAYGKDGATIEEIRAAADLANASKFINDMPQGLDTIVSGNGTQLSGGQKQRVAIARAILKDPRILLLDEATSALDAESECTVQEALEKIMRNRTTVIVAHRLRTVRNADLIAVIHKGKLVEKGSHGELLKDPNGAYSQLIHLQEVNKASEEQDIDQNILQNNEESLAEEMEVKDSLVPRSSMITHSAETKNEFSPSPATNRKTSKHQILRLISLNKLGIPAFFLGSIAAVMNGLVLPVFGLLIALAIKTFFAPHDELKRDSQFWALMFLVTGVSSLIASLARSYFFALAGCNLIKRIRLICFEKVVRMEVGWFDKPENSSGVIGARLSTDAASLQGLVGDPLTQLISNLASMIVGLVIAFVSSWQLALVILVLFPILGVNNYIQVKLLKGFTADAKRMQEEASQVVGDAVGSIRTVASFCAEEKLIQIYKTKSEGTLRTGKRQGLISGIGFGISIFSIFSIYALTFYAGARLIADGKTTFSNVFKVFFALSLAAMTIAPSSSVAVESARAKSAAASIFAIVDQNSKIDPSDECGITMDSVMGEIEFHHVCFRYPSRPDVQIFEDLSLAIHPGKTVALVGESGSGKSTVISLLQRFYNPNSGQITLDGIEIQKFQVKWLRQQMGLVSQEPTLFNDTIRANIAYGKEENATEAEISAASRLANAHKFICGLQQGYDTIVGERGVQLSGGQKQRIAIARAIIKSPKILLLDEATSALDAESEKVVQDALDKVVMNRTTIIVAHKLSTIKNANTIAVVKNGVIVEKGNHETLISIKDGLYASLVTLNTNSLIA